MTDRPAKEALGVMQPYFFPHLGYFALIRATDRWVIFDGAQFIRHGWIERNRVLKQGGEGWIYIKVPLNKSSNRDRIDRIGIREDPGWRERILEQLKPYRKHAPHFRATFELVEEVLNAPISKIADLNAFALEKVCSYLGLPFDPVFFTDIEDEIGEAQAPDEWALRIAQHLGFSVYVNPEGGKTFFDREKYEREGVKLRFLAYDHPAYPQMGNPFEPRLSIIDALMFNSPEEVRSMLDRYKLL